ncbi:MAG: hypothetical protein U5K84_03950 [Alkalibacterium sp.]|nr:hypothetical protein [Alkalibacterium sp.]
MWSAHQPPAQQGSRYGPDHFADEGTGQGTSGSGIISPWLSKRRNKKWYKMVRDGAAFYPDFLSDERRTHPDKMYKQVGTLLLDESVPAGRTA